MPAAGHDGHDPLVDGAAPGSLETWLGEHLDGYTGPATLEKFSGGQSNPTFRLCSPSGDYVLRRKPLGNTLPSAHAVDREFRVLRALAQTTIPVPRVHALCLDNRVAGNMFYVMDQVPGRVFWEPALPRLTAAERHDIFASLNATIATLHTLQPADIGLSDYGHQDNHLARQISRWTKQYRASETHTIPAIEQLIEWLPENCPAEGEARLVHGDYRLDNVLIHPTRPKIVAVLDWELSTLGDPRADFAYHAMTWRFDPGLFRGLQGLDFAALGIPTETRYLQDYVRLSGIDPRDQWDFFLVLGMFRIAAIVQGIAKRAADGSASNSNAAQLGKLATPMAERALAIIEGRG